MLNENQVKALRCMSYDGTHKFCYAQEYNKNKKPEEKCVICGIGDNGITCPYYQDQYGVLYEDGECGKWLLELANDIENVLNANKERYNENN